MPPTHQRKQREIFYVKPKPEGKSLPLSEQKRTHIVVVHVAILKQASCPASLLCAKIKNIMEFLYIPRCTEGYEGLIESAPISQAYQPQSLSSTGRVLRV